MKINNFLDFIIKVQSISKIGLLYSKDPYAIENYEALNKLSIEMLENFENINLNRNNYFQKDIYPTPNISVRVIIFNENKEIMLVKEKRQQNYSLPGGWCDLYDSPSEAAIKEVHEEGGVDIKIKRLIGILDVSNTNSIPGYVIVFEGEMISDLYPFCHEIEERIFVKPEDVFKLNLRSNKERLKRMIDAALSGETIFD